MMLAQMTEHGLGMSLLLILVTSMLTENILLTRFLGMCPFLSVSKNLKSSFGMGLAVVFTTTCTCVLNYWLYVYLLKPLAPYGVPIESLKLILFIIVIAAFVQLMEMLIERVSLALYFSLGIFLPLITVNCAILGASLFMVNNVNARGYGTLEVLVYGFGAGAGWFIAIMLIGGIRQRLAKAQVPKGLEGAGLTLIITGIMALAFIIFQGMVKI